MENEKYYITTGKDSYLYVLRHTFPETVYGHGYVDNGVFNGSQSTVIRDYFVRNLSTDLDKAKEKAIEILGYCPKVSDDRVFNEIKRTRRSEWNHEILRFGKYEGLTIDEVLEKEKGIDYLVWAGTKFNSEPNRETIDLIKNHPVVKGIIDKEIEEKEKKQKEWEEEKENLKTQRENSNFICNIGERVELEVMVNKIIYFDGRFGTTIFHIMEDKEGNILVWFSSGTELEDEGEFIKVKATIKDHQIYKDYKQTVLTRVKEI